jgi:thiol-disulfide isomerase/thioredoxin
MTDKIMYEYKYYKLEVRNKYELLYIIDDLYKIYIDNFISTLQDSIKLLNIDITNCIQDLEKFTEENETNKIKTKYEHIFNINEENFIMNIYILLNKIISLLDKPINTTHNIDNSHDISIIIKNLNSWSLLLRYICLLLFIKNTNQSIIYLSKIIEYSSIFYNISNIITNFISSNSEGRNYFYIKSLNGGPNNFNVVKTSNLNNYTTTSDIIMLFTKIATNIEDNELKKLFEYIIKNPSNKETLYSTYSTYICNILTTKYEELELPTPETLIEKAPEAESPSLINFKYNTVNIIKNIEELDYLKANYKIFILYFVDEILSEYELIANKTSDIIFAAITKDIITADSKLTPLLNNRIFPSVMIVNKNHTEQPIEYKNDIINNLTLYLKSLKLDTSNIKPPELEPASAAPVPEHKKIHEIYNMKDVIRLSDDNKNILIIKYGGLMCHPCVLMDSPFKLLAEKNTVINYRYCKITDISKNKPKLEELITNGVIVEFDKLLNAGIMQENPSYPFIKINKDNLLYSIKNYYDTSNTSTLDDDVVNYYMKELNILLRNGFSNFDGLTAVNVNLEPAAAPPHPPHPPPPAAPPHPPHPPPPAAAPPPVAAEELLEDIKIVQDISTIHDLKPIMNSNFLVIINFYDYSQISENIKTEYNKIAKMNTNNNIRFYSINTNNVFAIKYATYLKITIFPTVAIFYKGTIITTYDDNSESDLRTILDIIDYKFNKVNEILSKHYLTKLMDEYNIVVVKYSTPWCGPCKVLAPIYEKIARENTNRDIIYTVLNPQEENLNFFLDEYEIKSLPTVIILTKGKEIKRFDGVDENMIEYLTKLSLPAATGGGNNKYKKTDKQITVIYKKKEYTRVIYICERKKYVKINKTFMLLSKLKKV